MILRVTVALTTLLIALPVVAGTELDVDRNDLRDLGVEFARPRAEGSPGLLTAQAYVTVPPDYESVVSSAESGLVLRMRVAVGDPVSAGQILAEVQSPAFLTRQQEFLEAAQAASVSAAQLERDEQLHAEGIIPARRLAETRARAVADSAREQEHRQMLRIAGLRRVDIEALASSLRLIETLSIRSPIDGVVLETMTTTGETVGPAEALCRVADVRHLWLDIRIPQERVSGVSAGMHVLVPRREGDASATVLAVGKAVDPETQTVSARAELRGDLHGLLPGQLVAARILPSAPEQTESIALAVPVAAVVRSEERAYVFVRSANGVTVEEITVAGRTDDTVYIRDADPSWDVAIIGVSALKAVWLASLDPDS